MAMISILILTLNEEKNLPACLETCRWSDDIHVLDSYSTDNTVKIAQSYGAKVWFRKFDSFSQHQNWALENIPFKHPWVFYYDADERITSELAVSMQTAVRQPCDNVAFRIQRRDFFLGRWLRHVQMTPFYDRLFRHQKMRYERLGHCVSRPDGPVGTLPGYLDHFPFSKGIAEWVAKHNFYSTQEAQQILKNREENTSFRYRQALFAKDTHERRRNLKELYYRMPARPLLKFLVMYIGKRGFMDAGAGFAYSVLIAFYEYMIVLKLRELEQLQKAHSSLPAGHKPR
ncbi:MAG: glycosyltransferase family 2 protein [Silvibacterium sp.]